MLALSDKLDGPLGGCAPLLSLVASYTFPERGKGDKYTNPLLGLQKQSQFQIFCAVFISHNRE